MHRPQIKNNTRTSVIVAPGGVPNLYEDVSPENILSLRKAEGFP